MTRARDRRGLLVATAWALVILASAAAVRLAAIEPVPVGERLVLVLIGIGAVCITGLSIRRLPALAWVSAVFAATIGLTDATAALRGTDEYLLTVGGSTTLALIDAAVLVTVACAARFAWLASSVGRGHVAARAITAAAFVVMLVVWASDVFLATTSGPTAQVWGRPAGRAVMSAGLWTIVVFVLIGSAGSLREPLRRARVRFGLGPRPPSRMGGLRRLVDLLADELLAPLRGAQIDAAREAERARVAADLHALVLPELRMAFATAVDTGAAAPVSARLRDALADVESLMAGAHSPVLERFGLVPALEWLAERTEARSDVRVTLDVDGPPLDDRVPRSVERAAFRVALLALDNVVRHADGANVVVRLLTEGERVSLTIVDDGPGFDPAGPGIEVGRRGLHDMREQATAVRAQLFVGPADEARGTSVRFESPR